MGGRLALVVGSECEALPRLGFVDELASDLYTGLTSLGGWESTRAEGGPLVNPSASELISAVEEGFAMAAARQAALLISFVGHGVATGSGNFFLLGRDSPPRPRSGSALHVVQVLSELLDEYRVDGLILLIDACETQEGIQGAAVRLTDRIELAARRIELLVAAGQEAAYNGCFTRTMLSVFERGLPTRGENLLPRDLLDPVESACPRQLPGHWGLAHGGDPGLWLVPNAARWDDAVFGRASAGLVDQLTSGVLVTDTLRRRIAQVYNDSGARLRGVLGSAGSGKSTLMSLLIRPNLLGRTPLSADYVTAAVFLSGATSLDSFTAELSGQLRRRVDGYSTIADRVLAERSDDPEADVFDVDVIEPLARVDTFGSPITLLVDGVDQAELGTRELIETAVAKLTDREDLSHVRVIVGMRTGSGLEDRPAFAEMHRIHLPPPTIEEIADLLTAAHNTTGSPDHGATGIGWAQQIEWFLQQTTVDGWLAARLLAELDTAAAMRFGDDSSAARLVGHRIRRAIDRTDAVVSRPIPATLAVLAAAGSGPVLPVELLITALSALGYPMTVGGLRDIVVALGALISRGNPGTGAEMLGLAHDEFIATTANEAAELGVAGIDAHHAITTAIETHTDERSTNYARGSGVRHYLVCDNSTAAIKLILRLETPRAADNRDMWASWLPAFDTLLGPDHPATLTIRNHLADWRGHSGDVTGAVAEFEGLLTDRRRVLGPDHPATLTTRCNLTSWRGESGDIAGVVGEFEGLLTDQERVLGRDHLDTLITRNHLAYWRGHSGDVAGAVAEFDRLLTDQLQVLGPDHPDTLTNRGNLADWRGHSGDMATAVAELERLLTDQLRVLGPDHPNTLTTRSDLARWRGHSGDMATAVAELERLLTDVLRVLGPDHPDSLTTRSDLARWRGRSGDAAGAVSEFEALLTDQLRVLSPDHPNTLITRCDLTSCRGMRGDMAGAVSEFEALLTDQLRVLGPDHPNTLITRNHLAFWRARSGDVANAIAECEGLLADQSRVLGPDHPETLTSRYNLATWHGQSGDVASAVVEFERLLTDQKRVLGPDHPDTTRTRKNLAHLQLQKRTDP